MCNFSLGTTLSGWRDVKIQELTDDLAELRSCVNKEVGPGPHSLSRSSPVPNKPYGFCGRKAPRKKKTVSRAQNLCEQGSGPRLSFVISFFPRRY